MEAKKENLIIKVLIGKQEYPFQIRREQEETYRKAARDINEKLGRYAQKFPGLSYERYTATALLDFAVQVVNLQMEKDPSPYDAALQRLEKEIDGLLELPSAQP